MSSGPAKPGRFWVASPSKTVPIDSRGSKSTPEPVDKVL